MSRSMRRMPVLIATIAILAAGGATLAQGQDFDLSKFAEKMGSREEGAILDSLDRRTTLITGEWVDVRSVLRIIAESNGFALQIAPDVDGLVNVHLEDVTVPQALQALLEPIDMGYELLDNVLMVYKRGFISRWFTFDYLTTSRSGRGELRISGRSKGTGGLSPGGEGENESHVSSKLEMEIWPEVIGALRTLVFDGADKTADADGESGAFSLADTEGRILVVSPMAGIVQVSAEWKRMRLVEGYLERMSESLHRQVAIEVKILEVSLDSGLKTGIDWSGVHKTGSADGQASFEGTQGLAAPFFKFVVNGKSVSSLVEAVQSQGNVKVISTPRITTMNNQKSVVRIVTEEVFYEATVEPPVVTNGVITEPVIAYAPSIIPVGIVLDVTPQIGANGLVTLNIHPTITSILRTVMSPNQDEAPVITVRELDTVGTVMDGETLVIAGLISDTVRDTESGVPLLGRIPLLGYFFKRKVKETTKTELVMLLTPIILDSERSGRLSRSMRGSIEEKISGQ